MEDNMKKSLCVVVNRERSADTRLKRLADIENGKLVAPPPAPEDGWNMMYWSMVKLSRGPSKSGTLGIWQWYGTPNYSDPDKIFIITEYLPNEKAVRVFPVEAADPVGLCDTLQKHGVKGRETDLAEADLFFAYLDPAGDAYCGTLLSAAECTYRDGRLYPVSSKITLPIYRLSAADIFTADSDMVALESAMGDPVSSIAMGNVDKLIEESLIEALSWPYFKNHTGGNRMDWRTCKDLIHGLFTKSVKDKVSEALGLSAEEADHMVAQWVDKASNIAELGSEDAQLMAAVAMKNDAVHDACMQNAASVWESGNAAKVAKAKEELQQLTKQIAALKAEEAETRGTVEGLRKSTANAKKTLSDMEAKIAASEKLAEDTEKAVQERIAHARDNMAEFLAEVSIIQSVSQTKPQPEPMSKEEPAQPAARQKPAVIPQPTGYTYTVGEARTVSTRVFNPIRTWRDAVRTIGRNLGGIVSPSLQTITAAYLYSGYLCGAQILAVGPCGQHLADALTAAVDGKRSGSMRLEAGCGYASADALLRNSDRVVTLQNLFHSGAVDILPQALEDAGRCLFWLHPFVEDLAVEPASLYSYMLPMLTEPLLMGKTMNFISFSSRSSNFSSFQPKTGPLLYETAFDKLHLSAIVRQQIQKLLFTAAGLAENNQAEIELLFGLLPLCTALGRQDVLREALGRDIVIMPEVVSALDRYASEVPLS